ncbi:cystatin-POGU1-like [Schistocerca cancellata]|uniref:cystatin-POGU1-like n=1 Tax=Schistocerca cancellata TaxID=274614 RepID=UPI002118AC06|nr:cystatin-POGU1-like [Schistocerca cancellata]
MKLVYFLVLYCLCISVNAHPPYTCNVTELAANAGHTEGNTTTIITGGREKANVSDPIIKNISAFALPTIDRRFDATFKIARIVSAETQVVEGVIYYIRLEVCSTNSNGGEDDASSDCIITGESNQQLCDIQVWDRPWLPKRELTQLNCTAID